MARKVFYSFHYERDHWRASQIRNIGAINGNPPAKDNEWEEVKRGGDESIRKWIDSQLKGRTCTVVLIGSESSTRSWIKYEIEKSWNTGMGVLGIYVHGLKDTSGGCSQKGPSPFDCFTLFKSNKPSVLIREKNLFDEIIEFFSDKKTTLSHYTPVRTPSGKTSKEVYECISKNLESWIDEAIAARVKAITLLDK